MKKLFLTAVLMLIGTFSFALTINKTINKTINDSKVIKLYRVYYHCTDGSGGGSFLMNEGGDAQAIANHLCS